MNQLAELEKRKKRNTLVIAAMLVTVILVSIGCLFVGSSDMSFADALDALLGGGSDAQSRIIWKIRVPRVLAAVIAGAGLSVAGLVMQTTLNNAMASPSTLGVSNAAVFGANLSIIVFAGGFLSTGNNLQNFDVSANPYATSLLAFVFATASVLLILGLCTVRSFSPNVVVLSGMAIGSVWTAATTILQFYATDVGLSAAVVWSFGDLGRATYRTDGIMVFAVALGSLCHYILNFHTLVDGLAHIIDGQGRHRDSRQRLHLHAGLAGTFGDGTDRDAVFLHFKMDVHRRQRQRVAHGDHIGCILGSHDARHLRHRQHIALDMAILVAPEVQYADRKVDKTTKK